MDVKIIILIIVTILSLIFGSIVSYATIIKNRKLYSILKAFPLLFLIIGFVICYPTKPILYLALIFALSVSKSYTLGLNLHWTPIPLRITLLKVILRLNKNNIKNNKNCKKR